MNNDAEPGEVQVRVECLEWIVGPLDQVDAHAECPLTLEQLEGDADAGASVGVEHAEHVRPLRRHAFLHRGNGINERDHAGSVERTCEDAAALHGDRENRHRHDVTVPDAPDFAFELDDGGEFIEGRGDRDTSAAAEITSRERGKLVEGRDDRHVLLRELARPWMVPAGAMQENGAHPGAERAFDILTDAVADHHRVGGRHIYELSAAAKMLGGAS